MDSSLFFNKGGATLYILHPIGLFLIPLQDSDFTQGL